MSSREVVTLQIGHYSNFIGTHWWNLQESSFVYDPSILAEFPKEVNHDVLFREGRTLKGDVTYTPRLVLFDLNNSLGSLKKEGTLYDADCEENIKWLGDVTLHQTPSARRNKYLQDLKDLDDEIAVKDDQEEHDDNVKEHGIDDTDKEIDVPEPCTSIKSEDQVFGSRFYNLDNDVKVWSDFLRTGLHPKSIHLIRDYQHNWSEQPFNIFGTGQQVCGDRQQWDIMEDKIRYFTEDCDLLQGFQILLDNHNAFGGLASSVLAYLSDEFSSKSRLSFALTPASPPDQTATDRSVRIMNSALSLSYCSEHSSLLVPLSLASNLWKSVGPPVQIPHLDYNASLDYHTSAVLAAALDTMTLPYRKETDPARMFDITSSLSSHNRKVSALNTSLPFPLKIGNSFAECLMSYGQTDPWVSLTPHVKCSSSPVFQSCVVRGVPSSMVKCEQSPRNLPRLLSSCSTVDDVLRLYLTETYPGSYNAGCTMRDGLAVGTPFPHIFSRNINYQGFLMDTQRSPLSGVETVAAMTSLQSSADIFSYIDSLEGCVSRFNIAKHQHFIEAGLEADDFSESIQCLKELAECYKIDSGRQVKIKWQDKIPDTAILDRAGIPSISTILMESLIHWAGHVVHMPDHRPPKVLLCRNTKGKRFHGGPKKKKHFKDMLKTSLKAFGINLDMWEPPGTHLPLRVHLRVKHPEKQH